jgi:dienelactone hydrolase
MYWNSDISPNFEPRRVTLEKDVWVDAKRRNREIPYKIYRPETTPDEKLPVILWSHGLGGSRDGAGFISRFVAANGYIIVHVQHIGTDTILWEGKPGHPWDNIRKAHIPRYAAIQRNRDIPFTLDKLHALNDPTMDLTRIGMSGHSFGALTTQIMAGQRIVRGSRHYDRFCPSFVAGILYSPVPGRTDVRDPTLVYGGIRIPLLHITGTDDDSPVEGFGYERRLNVFRHAGHADQHLIILKNGDHMVFNGSRGQLAANPLRDRHEDIIKILSLAWWDWRLKNDNHAHTWMTGTGLTTWLKDDATVEHKG